MLADGFHRLGAAIVAGDFDNLLPGQAPPLQVLPVLEDSFQRLGAAIVAGDFDNLLPRQAPPLQVIPVIEDGLQHLGATFVAGDFVELLWGDARLRQMLHDFSGGEFCLRDHMLFVCLHIRFVLPGEEAARESFSFRLCRDVMPYLQYLLSGRYPFLCHALTCLGLALLPCRL